jgi:hypothetical protein
MSGNAPRVFKREWYIRVVFDLFLIVSIPLMIWITAYAFSPSYPFDDFVGARIIGLLFLIVFCPCLFLVRTSVGNIHVDDDGIGWWAWGRRWLYIRWSEVKVITVAIIAAYNQIPPTQTIYSLYRTEKTPSFHLLRFDDHMPNAGALIDAVDRNVRKHNIPVLDRRGDGSAARKRYFLWVPVSKTEVRRTSLK